MADPVHNAVLGNVTGTERELKGGRGPWIERSYPKGDQALAFGEVVALSNADVTGTYVKGSAYPWISGDANVGTPKGISMADAAAEEVGIDLVVFGSVNRDQLKVAGAAPDADALAALEERHIYAVG
jgi:hypothetical protein